MVELPRIDARFIHLDEPKALVEYAKQMAELLEFWEDQELVRTGQRCKSEGLDASEAEAEFEVIQYTANRFASFLGSQVVLHAWALLEGLIKWVADFVANAQGLLDSDGNGPRLSSRGSWPKGFNSGTRDPVERWVKWFHVVLDYPIPLSSEQLDRARSLSWIRNSIGHELMDEPSAQAARIDRIVAAAPPSLAELLRQIDPAQAFGTPPGMEWAEQVAAIADTMVAKLKHDFPGTSSKFQFWSRPPLGNP